MEEIFYFLKNLFKNKSNDFNKKQQLLKQIKQLVRINDYTTIKRQFELNFSVINEDEKNNMIHFIRNKIIDAI